MRSIHITAVDTLFFRDGKPFSMGEETWANGVFPPFPSVFYGALRSIWFAENLLELNKANNRNKENPIDNDSSLNLRITRLLPTITGDTFFPIPNDLYRLRHQNGSDSTLLKCISRPDHLISDYEFNCMLRTHENVKIEELGGKALLSYQNFEKYLANTESSFQFLSLPDYVLLEPKVGIGRNRNSRSAENGQLYRVAMRRLHSEIRNSGGEQFGFAVSYKGLEFIESGLSRFGAEIKAVDYVPFMQDQNIFCPVNINDKYFKIYLSTPAIYEDEFYPRKWFKKHGMELLTAAFGRVQHIGGFDMKALRPKPMYKAVPSGTVYYVEMKDGITDEIINTLHSASIYNLACDNDALKSEFQPQGFGLSYLGKFNIEP